MKLRFTFLILLTFFVSNITVAEPKTTSELLRGQLFVNPNDINEEIMETWQGGAWKEKGLKGNYRFVVAKASNGANKLYVQWVRSNKEVAYSMSIRELNQRPEYSFKLPLCKSDSCESVEINATHFFEKHVQKFVFSFPRLGKYALNIH